MKANIYIESDLIGSTHFKIADIGMGGIIGDLSPNENYKKYRPKIQSLTENKGIANSEDFKFIIKLNDNQILNPEGGIGITDMKGYNEIIIESAGNPYEIIQIIDKLL